MTDHLNERLHEIQVRGGLRRDATVCRSAVNTAERTVELSFSSETDTVSRFFGIEILGHDTGEVDLSRLNNGAPVLWMHNARDQRGVVESARIDGDRVGRAVVRFSRSPEGDTLLQDIADGITTKVSVGYTVEGLSLVDERGDVAVYRATAWTPYEISMVSVPADDSVGIGRAAEIHPQPMSLRTPATPVPGANEATRKMNELEKLLAAARRAPGSRDTLNDDGSVRHRKIIPATAVSHYSLRDLEVPAFAADAFREIHFPVGFEAGKSTKLSHVLLAGSRAVAAGAKLIILPGYDTKTHTSNGVTAYAKREARLDLIEAADFMEVMDGQDVSESELPIARALVDFDEITTFGFRVKLPRAEQKAYQDGQLANSTLASIALGLARLADRVLLDAIVASTPATFSLAAAAAAGFEFSELRAVIGTTANGATVGQDGILRAAGILAELTPDTAATVVGAFNRSAIAVHPEIGLIAERTNLDGSMTVTCWASMQALLPRPGAFWTVGA